MDDLWAEMKRGESVKKPAPAPKTDIGSFINGLVSKSSAAGGAAASKGAGAKFDVASLFPTSVTKKQTVKARARRPDVSTLNPQPSTLSSEPHA